MHVFVDQVPLMRFKIKEVQVIQLFCDIVEASKYHHVVSDDVTRMPCSFHGLHNAFIHHLDCRNVRFDLTPYHSIEV